LDAGWNPHTSVVCVGADPAFMGQVMTFRASSWGARDGFNALIGGYVRLKCQQYPKVYLSVTTKRRSGYTVKDPMFCIVGWVPCKAFAADHTPALEGPAAPQALEKPAEKQEGPATKRGSITIESGRQPAAKAELDDDIPW
jgi:hypothetical protein